MNMIKYFERAERYVPVFIRVFFLIYFFYTNISGNQENFNFKKMS